MVALPDGGSVSDEQIPGLEISDVPTPKPPTKPDHTASEDGPLFNKLRDGAQRRRTARETKAQAPKPPVAKQRPGFFVKPVERLYAASAMACMIKAPQTGAAIMAQAHECAVAWDEIAQKNDAVRKTLMLLTETSVWGVLVVAHLPIILSAMNEGGLKNPALDMIGSAMADDAEQYLRENNGDKP